MFSEMKADAWSIPDVDAVCITTNGFISNRGVAAVGVGIAKSAQERYPELGVRMADKLLRNGHQVQIILSPSPDPVLVSFPVKPAFVLSNGHNVVSFKQKQFPQGAWVPGFYAKATLEHIESSAKALRHLVNVMQWSRVIVPRPGCGAGELLWNDVRDVLCRHLDERFIVVHV